MDRVGDLVDVLSAGTLGANSLQFDLVFGQGVGNMRHIGSLEPSLDHLYPDDLSHTSGLSAIICACHGQPRTSGKLLNARWRITTSTLKPSGPARAITTSARTSMRCCNSSKRRRRSSYWISRSEE